MIFHAIVPIGILIALFILYIATNDPLYAKILLLIIIAQSLNPLLKRLFAKLYIIAPALKLFLGPSTRPRNAPTWCDTLLRTPSGGMPKATFSMPKATFGMPSGHAQFYAFVASIGISLYELKATAPKVFIIALSLIGAFSRTLSKCHTWQQVAVGYAIGLGLAWALNTPSNFLNGFFRLVRFQTT